MMNNEMLANIEYLREKANVSYEEAEQLLEQHNGNVMRVLVELEHQGRVYSQTPVDYEPTQDWGRAQAAQCDGMKKTRSFLQRAFKTHLVVEKKAEDGKVTTVANLPVPFALAVLVCAPWLTVAIAGVVVVTGHTVRIAREEAEEVVA